MNNGERAIVAPLVGIANLVANLRKLNQCLLLRLWTHPVKLPNALSHGGFDTIHHVQRAGLQRRREYVLDINLSQRFAEIVIRILHAAPPARLHLFGPAQILSVELKILLHKVCRQERRILIGNVKAQIVFPVLRAARWLIQSSSAL